MSNLNNIPYCLCVMACTLTMICEKTKTYLNFRAPVQATQALSDDPVYSTPQIPSLGSLSPHFPSVNMCIDTRAQFSAIHAQPLFGRCSQIVTILLAYDLASNCSALLLLASQWLVAPPMRVVFVLAWAQRSRSVNTRRSKRYSRYSVCVRNVHRTHSLLWWKRSKIITQGNHKIITSFSLSQYHVVSVQWKTANL